jgi:hypothetical protein
MTKLKPGLKHQLANVRRRLQSQYGVRRAHDPMFDATQRKELAAEMLPAALLPSVSSCD